jgi:hypothetical protein
MSMLQICAAPGCGTRTLGQFCIAHEESPVEQQQMRERPTLLSTPSAAQRSSPRPIFTTHSRAPVGRAGAL